MEDEFQCPPNGPCLPNMYLCDNITDCADGFDEEPEICNITGQHITSNSIVGVLLFMLY